MHRINNITENGQVFCNLAKKMIDVWWRARSVSGSNNFVRGHKYYGISSFTHELAHAFTVFVSKDMYCIEESAYKMHF